jgi:ABC-type spermidine/putrescine transport system permease subunit I
MFLFKPRVFVISLLVYFFISGWIVVKKCFYSNLGILYFFVYFLLNKQQNYKNILHKELFCKIINYSVHYSILNSVIIP